MDKIDFRSDTVTWPTPEMREAMAQAPLGDDVYGEDPTVNRLEALAAEMLGKEAGLFVSSGTQGNLTCVLTHTGRGEEAIVGADGHIFTSEAGGLAALGGVVPKPLPTDSIGRLNLLEVCAAAVRGSDNHYPITRLICTENSAGSNHGAAIPPDYFAALRRLADDLGLQIHLDGARLFNASTALGVDPREITQHVDSVSICLSKGLCAPVGSVVVGSAPFIERVRRTRKILGGGMRQAGVIAAAGLIALEKMTRRLDEDHRHARLLAEKLAQIPGVVIDPNRVQTNMVFFELAPQVPLTHARVVKELRERDQIWLGGYSSRNLFRAVTHYWVGEEEIERLVNAFSRVMLGVSV